MQCAQGCTSVELQIDVKKLFFFARIVSNDGMSPVVRDIFRFRAKEYFRNPDCVPTGFMGDIEKLIKKFDLHSYQRTELTHVVALVGHKDFCFCL